MDQNEKLTQFVWNHTLRGTCRCGRCIDAPTDEQPDGHTVDMFFFEVAAKGDPDADTFRHLIAEHRGVHAEVDPLDGREHGYIELGGWIGDQGLAMQMMGLGAILGLWRVLQPNLLPLPDEMKKQMAGMGMVSICPAGES